MSKDVLQSLKQMINEKIEGLTTYDVVPFEDPEEVSNLLAEVELLKSDVVLIEEMLNSFLDLLDE